MSMPRKIRCTVAAVIPHGGRVYTVDLKPEMPVPGFRPGQFLHLTVDEYDPAGFWPESRVFSVASSPRDRQRIRLCYAVKGRYTARLEEALRPGVEAWVKLPYGEFVIDDTQDAVLIAGGTGISAFTAFIEALLPETSRKVCLVYGARTPGLWLFRDMIEQQLARCPSFSAVFFAESGLAPGVETLASVPRMLQGRISLDRLFPSTVQKPPSSDCRPLSSDLCSLSSPIFYLSGPPPMLASLRADLQSRGVAADRIRTDAWD